MTNHAPPTHRFRKCPTYMPRETAQGYLGRLTSFFGSGSPREFCRDFNLDIVGIQHGERSALTNLAAITGASADDLIRWTPQRIDRSFISINGEILPSKWTAFSRVRICPVCAREDILNAPSTPLDQVVYIRSEWSLRLVESCCEHNVRLVEHTDEQGGVRARQDLGYNLTNVLQDLKRISPVEAQPNDFERYVLGRIGVLPKTVSSFLDDLPISLVCQLCHNAGHDLLHRRGIVDASGAQYREAGFAFFGSGRESIEQHFLEMRRGIRLAQLTVKLLPRLCIFLAQNEKKHPGLVSLADVFCDVCFRNLPYAEGQVLLGRPCPRRSLFSFYDAVAHFGIAEDRLQAFVVGTPEIAAYVGDRRNDTIIRVAVAERLFKGRLPFISTSAVARKLGRVTADAYRVLEYLEAAGVVRREPGACGSTAAPFYSEPGLEASVAEFKNLFSIGDARRSGMRSVQDLAAAFRIPVAEIWKILASGKIKCLALVPGEPFLKALRIDETALAIALTGLPDPINYKRAVKILCVSPYTMSRLLAHCFLRPDVSFHAPGQNAVHYFAPATLKSFQARYVQRINKRVVIDGISVTHILEARGVTPAISINSDYKKLGPAVFFHRADVEKALAVGTS